jgi:hypothetical protein
MPAPPDPLAPPLEAPACAQEGAPFGHVSENTSSGSELHDSTAETTLMLRKRVEIADIVPGLERAARASALDGQLAHALA